MDATYWQVAKNLQAAIHHWQGGIHVSGGVPEKMHWYLVDYKWMAGKWHYAMVDETLATLCIQDADGNIKLLRHLSVEVAECTLGVRIAPDSNMVDEANFLKEVTKDWADNIPTGHLPRDLAWQSLTTMVLK